MNKRTASCSLLTVLGASLFVHGCPGSFGPAGAGGLSDVPCFTPSEWPGNTRHFAYRRELESSATLLFTVQTSDQFQDDLDFDFVPHEAVYRFDPVAGDFTLVEDSEWDTAEGEVCGVCADLVDEGPFVIQDGKLFFNGRAVPVAGRRARNIFDARISTCVDFDAPTVEAIAVLSIDGNVTLFGASSGQHYHQLFSKADGSEIGSVQRLAMGGTFEGTVRACWSEDEEYIVYRNGTQERAIAGRICIVPVPDELSQSAGE